MRLNLIANEFELFLNAITQQWCLKETSAEKLKFIGIDPNHWPDIPAREMLREFVVISRLKGHGWARTMLSDQYLALEPSSIPDDLNDIRVLYHHNLKTSRSKTLAHDLLKSPDCADSHVANYLSNRPMFLEMTNISDQLSKTVVENEKLIFEKRSKIVLPDFPIISDKIGGFNPKRVTLLSATSGFGKTKLAVNFALSASKIMPVIYFNMEMGIEDFSALFIHNKCQIKNTDWYSGSYLTEFNLKKIETVISKMKDRFPILASSGRSQTIDDIISSILVRGKENEQTFVVIDYDQKIISKNYDQEWMGILRSVERLEDVAKETNSHIVLLVQADDSGSGNPKASKRSKQPASAVLNFTQSDSGDYIIRAIKNRFGPNGFEVEMSFDAATSFVSELGLYTKDTSSFVEQKNNARLERLMGVRK